MPTLTLREVPDQVYSALRERAERNRRSLNSEAIVCLEQALAGGPTSEDVEEKLAALRRVRTRARKVWLTDAALAAAREEGRR